jgi:hypothetical protein
VFCYTGEEGRRGRGVYNLGRIGKYLLAGLAMVTIMFLPAFYGNVP